MNDMSKEPFNGLTGEFKAELDRVESMVKEVAARSEGKTFKIIFSTMVAVNLALLGWTADVVIRMGERIAKTETRVDIDTSRIARIEDSGSSGLQSHVKEDDSRIKDMRADIDRLEAAILNLSSVPGEIKAISMRIDATRETVNRIEKILDKRQ